MLNIKEGEKAVVFARKVIENFVKNKEPPEKPNEKFLQKRGIFVTIHTYPDHKLRGCIGVPLPTMPLRDAIVEGAKSATHDPRFLPLSEEELDNIIVEVTILTKPEEINVERPKEYIKKIEIGRDGLIVEQGFFKGLLLPQVPVEQGWVKKEFLANTCLKAGLMPDAWLDEKTRIFKFRGQVFSEVKPRGEIKEKKLNGS
ncbi:MAG: TIGR00296 family protein [Elusimicrobiota bacterium]